MNRTRKYRTECFREQVEHEWKEKFWKFIEDNLEQPWDWIALSRNPNITFDIVQTHPNKPWDWDSLSQNPNITFDNVLSYPDKPWEWGCLSQNTFIKAKQQFIERRYKEYLFAYRIQQCWNRAYSIPTNPICKRKQIRDYEKCSGRLYC